MPRGQARGRLGAHAELDSPAAVTEANRRIDDAAFAAGREPAANRRVLNIGPGLVHPEAPAELGQVPGIDMFVLMSDDPG
ncbi:hypothetical protein [Streptomyces hyderabadensis]|uniref:Uncharacterized protein n=1 Tax=Streptomyces hyderabadensis TaxID=598549 RepID=A0ABP9HGV3_9ACTN|nr:hypothetical protein [Streptomyces hyderabadensis]